MVNLRAQKILNVADEYADIVVEGHADARVVWVGWGSTYGSLLAACLRCEALGLPVALLHLRHLNPLPQRLGQLLQAYERVLVAELQSLYAGKVPDELRLQFADYSAWVRRRLAGGRLGRMRSSSARTPRAISSVFAFDCASTASVTPGWPLSRL